MSSPDLMEYGEIARELRAAQPLAPTELRERVQALVVAPPEQPAARPRRRRLTFRRVGLVLAPAAATAVTAAVVIGIVQSGSGPQTVVAEQHAAPGAGPRAVVGTAPFAQKRAAAPAPRDSATLGKGVQATGLPVTSSRVQRYQAELTLKVHDLSAATKRALRLTRGFGGYVRSVDYGQGGQSGRADLVVRIPLSRVQGAIVRFSSLGTILAQHVSIQDLQPSIDRRFRKMQELRHAIAVLEAKGTPEARAQASVLRGRLAELRKEQAQTIRRAGFATLALALRTKEAATSPPSRPGRIQRALDHSGTILLKELAVLLYVLVVGAPIALLAAGAYLAARALRRRSYERLLEQS